MLSDIAINETNFRSNSLSNEYQQIIYGVFHVIFCSTFPKNWFFVHKIHFYVTSRAVSSILEGASNGRYIKSLFGKSLFHCYRITLIDNWQTLREKYNICLDVQQRGKTHLEYLYKRPQSATVIVNKRADRTLPWNICCWMEEIEPHV